MLFRPKLSTFAVLLKLQSTVIKNNIFSYGLN